MKAFFLPIALLASSGGIAFSAAQEALEPWTTQPLLKALRISATTTLDEYSWWAERWVPIEGRPQEEDRTINLLAETSLIPVQMALEKHPNRKLLEQCLMFLGTQIPEDFLHLWRARILEMASIDKESTTTVNAALRARGLPTLEERASVK